MIRVRQGLKVTRDLLVSLAQPDRRGAKVHPESREPLDQLVPKEIRDLRA